MKERTLARFAGLYVAVPSLLPFSPRGGTGRIHVSYRFVPGNTMIQIEKKNNLTSSILEYFETVNLGKLHSNRLEDANYYSRGPSCSNVG